MIEEQIEEQIIDTIPSALVSSDAKNKQDTTLAGQADSETSSADNADRSSKAAAIIVANFLLKHIIDTYICLDALIPSVIGSTVADLGVEPSANVDRQVEHYASNGGGFDSECFNAEMMIVGNSKALIEVY